MLLKQVYIYDEKVDFFKEKLFANYSEVDVVYSKTYIRDGLTATTKCLLPKCADTADYVSINLRSGGTIVEIKRNFPKLFSTLGELGGFIEIVVLIFGLVFALLSIRTNK